MCRHINSLDDDCLISIFKNLPTDDLLRAELVCHRWAAIQAIVCNTKTALVLLDSDLVSHYIESCQAYGLLEHHSFRCLKVHNLSRVSRYLARKFPSVCRLEIYQPELGAVLEPVLYLLDQWRNRLSHLTVFIGSQSFLGGHESKSWPRLIWAIDQLPALSHLTLFDKMRVPSNVQLPNLSRLKEFNFGLGFNHLSKMFAQLDQCTRLDKLSISIDRRPPSNFHRQLAKIAPSVASGITNFSLIIRPLPRHQSELYLTTIGAHFDSLTNLHIVINCQLTLLAQSLSHLRHLKYLRMDYHQMYFSRDSLDQEMAQMSSVRTLHLDCNMLPHACHNVSFNDSCFGVIQGTFPELECIKLETTTMRNQLCLCCGQDSPDIARCCFETLTRHFCGLNTIYMPLNLGIMPDGRNGVWFHSDERYLASYQEHHLRARNGTNGASFCRFGSIEL